ncbi:MAG: phosphoribosyltransferase [Opitutae bacterium]|nr:phosphoribosyltransferase [Opitutae bacterium]
MNTTLSTHVFRDRQHAGDLLASRLQAIAPAGSAIVLGLPRGGVPVAAAVARKLGCPLDVIVVHKLCVPGDEEIAFGALASGGVEIHNEDIISSFGLPPHTIGRIATRARIELAHREHLVRWARPLLALRDALAVIVDDGMATGATMRAAVCAARWRGAARVIVAAPVAAHESVERLRQDADAVVSVIEPDHLLSVDEFYADFSSTTDDEVLAILRAQPFGVGHVEEDPL